MEKYDYYAIKAAWNGANVSQRADDIKAAEKIADDLKGNGFIDVVIFGVKAGKREKLEGGKQAKPKAQERPRKDTKPKAQKKAAPKVKTPVKDAKKPQDKGGQLDLFTNWQRIPDNNTWDFTKDEIKLINDALGYYTLNSKNRVYLDSHFKKPENIVFDGLTNAFYEMAKNGNEQIILNNDDLRALVNVMGNYYRIKTDNTRYEANKLFMMFNSNIGD